MRLRPTRPDELEWVMAAEEHPENRPFVTRWTRTLHAEALTHPDLAHLVIETRADGRAAGYVILAGLETAEDALELRRIVVTEKGRGHGRETLRLIARLAFDELKTRKLWLDVRANNTRARRLYEEEGFKAESTTPDGLTILSITRERSKPGKGEGEMTAAGKAPVGFIGLGIMGTPMAGHIMKGGHPLVVFNRTPSKTTALAAAGAEVAGSPAEVAERSGIIITMVSDTPDVEQVVAGPRGILERLRPDSIVVDMSTVAPALERRLDGLLRERGCSLVDAPVSGGDVGAKNATLAIMAGGDRQAFERVRPVLGLLGKTLTYCGPSGSGQIAKLCNQILISLTLLGVSEALVFARRNGLDPEVMIDAVSGGAAQSWQLTNLGPRIIKRDFAPGFMVDLVQKDLRLVLEAAATAGVSLPATGLVHQLFRAAQAHGSGREGTQSLGKVVERLSVPD